MGRVFDNRPRDRSSIPRRIIPKTPCSTLSIIRYISMVKWSNPEKGVAPFPTLRCGNEWRRSLRVTLHYDRQLYLLIKYVYMYVNVHMPIGPGDRGQS